MKSTPEEQHKPVKTRAAESVIKRILVPVEFSDASLCALRAAVDLAAQLAAQLILLHVVEVHITGSWPFDVAQVFSDSHSKSASKQLDQVAKTEVPPEILDHTSLLHGAPAREIARAAMNEQADLIILASHCRKGFQYALLGSVTEALLRAAPCPVLVVPANVPDVPTEKTNSTMETA